MAFHCPQCDGKTGVLNTRLEMRERKCHSCGHRFLTEEVEWEPPPGFNLGGARQVEYRARKAQGVANAANKSA